MGKLSCPLLLVRKKLTNKNAARSFGKSFGPRHSSIHRLGDVRSLDTEVVRYRVAVTHKKSHKTVYARVPTTVKELVRLRIQGDGKAVPEGRIARMAVDLMEKNGYDPVSAVRSLSRKFFLCPTSPTRMLGSGDYGAVFLEEETGYVVKVMFDDDAPHEYNLLSAFARVGLAPQPIDIWGPVATQSGKLYNIRMEAVDSTLDKVLWAEAPGSDRLPLSEAAASNIGSSLATTLSNMRHNGLVHADLHLGNVGLKRECDNYSVLLLDFSRSANITDKKSAQRNQAYESFFAGHEFDVFNVMQALFESFEQLRQEILGEVKTHRKKLQSLERHKRDEHRAQQIGDVSKFLVKRQGAIMRAEVSHNKILRAVADYARTLQDWKFDESPTVRNRSLKSIVSKRAQANFKKYFKSDLYWGDFQYKE